MNENFDPFKNLRIASEYDDKSNEKYYDWVRQMLTMSTGSLTLLVSFRASLIGANPQWIPLIQTSWIAFALAASLAAVVLLGESNVSSKLSRLYVARQEKRISESPVDVPPDRQFVLASYFLYPSLLLAVVALCIFAIVNTSPPHIAKP